MISIDGKYPKYDAPPLGLEEFIKRSSQTSINEYPWNRYSFDINKANRINWDKLPIKSQTTQTSTSKSNMNRYIPPTTTEEQRKRIIELLNKQKDTVKTTINRSDRPYAGKDGAGVAPWAKEGISYEQWRAKQPTTVQSQGGHNFTIPITRGGPAFKVSLGNDYPLLGKDPITWSPIKKSSQSRTGTRTGKNTTRKPMGLGAVLGILKTVVPVAWNIIRGGGDILVNTFFQGQYGEQITFDKESQDEMPSASEIKGEEILVATRADLTKRQIFAAVADQAHIESSAFHMPTLGLKHSQVTVSLHLEYQ